MTVVGSSPHDHEVDRKTEATSTDVVEVVSVAQPEVVARLSEAEDTATRTGIAPTQVGSVKDPLAVIMSTSPSQS